MDSQVLTEDVIFAESEIFTDEKTSEVITRHELTAKQRNYLVLKRIADFCIAFVSLIILAIPFLIIAVIQKIVDPKEPIFFVQERVGKGGKIIKITKFRSMKSIAPHDCPTKDFSGGEQYITKWGRLLRNTSIDELPQLFQVASGEMSLIGPRPLIPQEENVHKMREEAGIYQLRPGITGWAQVNGRDHVDDSDKVKLDFEYLENLGFKLDLKIFFLTIKKVLKKADIEEGTNDKKELISDGRVK